MCEGREEGAVLVFFLDTYAVPACSLYIYVFPDVLVPCVCRVCWYVRVSPREGERCGLWARLLPVLAWLCTSTRWV